MNQTKKIDIQMLKKEVVNNKVLDAVCHVFALRKRSRSRVTVHGLQLAMSSEGFKFTKKQLIDVIVLLSRAGVGKLNQAKNDSVRGITDIDITLQSLGKAVVTQEERLSKNRGPQKKYYDILPEVEKMHEASFVEVPKVITKPPVRQPSPYPAFLTLLVEGKPMTFSGPSNLTADNLADFLGEFKRMSQRDKDSM